MKRFLVFLILFLSLTPLSWGQEEKFPFVGEVQQEDINIRAGQSTSFDRVGQLKKGDQVVVVEKAFDWYKIKLPETSAVFISADYIKELGENVGEVKGSRVNVRSSFGANSSVVGQANKGQLVHLIERQDKWYKVQPIDESYGWVATKFISTTSAAIPEGHSVQAPVRNIYQKKRLAEQQPTQAILPTAQPVSPAQPVIAPPANVGQVISVQEIPGAKSTPFAIGVVDDLGDKALSSNIRHRLIVNEKTVYYLEGYRRIIDGFLHDKVKVEGTLQPKIKAEHPVLHVTRIQLVL
jgi:SH3-like domain-containing protein